MIFATILHCLGTILGKCQHAIIGMDSGRQLLKLVREATTALAIKQGFALNLISTIVTLKGELDRLRAFEQLLIPLAERYRIDINTYGLGAINELLGHSA